MMHIYFVKDDIRMYVKDMDTSAGENPVIHTTYNCSEAMHFPEKAVDYFRKIFNEYKEYIVFLDPEEDCDMDIEEFFTT